MCLYTNQEKIEIAKKDIVCYKVVLFDDIFAEFKCMFMGNTIPKDVINGKKPFRAKGNEIKKDKYFTYLEKYTYGRGFIHTMKYLKDAYSLQRENNAKVFKCIIPKGTKYVTGRDDWGHTSYAAKEIIFKEEKEKK